jgi:signal transduction histidine kinase
VVEESASGRFDPGVEAAAYFCVLESMNHGSAVSVVVEVRDDVLRVELVGVEGDGSALGHMRDRVEAVGGSVTMSAPGRDLRVDVRLPAPQPATASHSSVRRPGASSDLVT